jgi:hypothetical protein
MYRAPENVETAARTRLPSRADRAASARCTTATATDEPLDRGWLGQGIRLLGAERCSTLRAADAGAHPVRRCVFGA